MCGVRSCLQRAREKVDLTRAWPRMLTNRSPLIFRRITFPEPSPCQRPTASVIRRSAFHHGRWAKARFSGGRFLGSNRSRLAWFWCDNLTRRPVPIYSQTALFSADRRTATGVTRNARLPSRHVQHRAYGRLIGRHPRPQTTHRKVGPAGRRTADKLALKQMPRVIACGLTAQQAYASEQLSFPRTRILS
jgi:hypothetical protein